MTTRARYLSVHSLHLARLIQLAGPHLNWRYGPQRKEFRRLERSLHPSPTLAPQPNNEA